MPDPSSLDLATAPAGIQAELERIAGTVQEAFRVGRRVMSFEEYLALYARDPARQGRDASRYVRDMFEHYGKEEVDKPWGKRTRYKLFDLGFEPEVARRDRLVGQEDVQGEILRVFENFGREGRPNKLLLLHGPNGSSKSTMAMCLMRALEHYSSLDEGALYRFHWVFPSAKTVKSRIGFGGEEGVAGTTSFAHLPEDLIDAKLINEIRDHPLFLLPIEERKPIMSRTLAAAGVTEPPPDWLVRGRLSHKSQQVFEALLNSYRGDMRQVLRHVSVERWFVSRRYRTGAVTLGPQMSVDAGERQITADRSLAALPAALEAVTLFDAFGELIDAAGGILEYSDLLKRPLESYKYLQLSVETGEVALQHQNVQLNVVLVGSANEVHLLALREHPEWASFRGRLELVRTPYLRSYVEEQQIYDAQIAPHVRRHVAPHATYAAALFAVLTRMRKPRPEHFAAVKGLPEIVGTLTVLEKADLYSTGRIPERLDADQEKVLRAHVRDLYDESKAYPIYEGLIGASPREIKGVLLDAAQDPRFSCLSPLAVLDELEELVSRSGEYEWLKQEPMPGAYHDARAFLGLIRGRLLDLWEDELRVASGLVEQRSWNDLFDRYVRNVSVWVKGEKVKNALTGDYEDPDQTVMQHVEKQLGQKKDEVDAFRHGIIGAIAAWSIDHPGEKIDNATVFPQHLRKLKEAVFGERSKAIADLCKWLVVLVEDEGKGLRPEQRKAADEAMERMLGMGYDRGSARDAASALLHDRFR